MSRNNDNGISLSTPPAIRVGPIVAPGTNETISIVIPLSAQLTTVAAAAAAAASSVAGPPKTAEKTSGSSATTTTTTTSSSSSTSCKDCNDGKNVNGVGPVVVSARNDKTKGCPFPTCTRYGRAFSRAHDLKRHIARHEMRKERLANEVGGPQPVRPYAEYAGNFASIFALQRDRTVKTEDFRGEVAVPVPVAAEPKLLYACRHCNEKFAQECALKAHLVNHEKASEKNVCTLCGYYLQSKEEAEEHMKQHTVSILQAHSVFEKFNVPAEKDATEKEDDFLLEEMLLLNKNPRCSTSGRGGGGGGGTNPGKIRCDYCSKTFKTKWTLSSHVAAHEGRFQFDCGQCGKRFVRKSHYEGHVRSHEAARPFVCEQCGKTFKELKHRREHTKRKHPGLHQGAMGRAPPDSSRHVLEKSAGVSRDHERADASGRDYPLERKDDFLLDMLLFKKNPRLDGAGVSVESASNIRCDYCSKTFKTRWSLTSHVAAHEGRFRFDCGQCGKRFVRKSHYEGHVRSHEAARPFVCEHCGKSFKELKHRREHMKKKHPAEHRGQIAAVLNGIDHCAADKYAIADGMTACNAATTKKLPPAEQSKLSLSMPVNFNAYYS